MLEFTTHTHDLHRDIQRKFKTQVRFRKSHIKSQISAKNTPNKPDDLGEDESTLQNEDRITGSSIGLSENFFFQKF